MTLRKLSSTDAFVVQDFADAPASGIVRRAKKILQGGATDMARSATYTFASFEIERSGASAGINAEDDAAVSAIEAFGSELGDSVTVNRLHLYPGKGVSQSLPASLSPDPKQFALAGSSSALAAGVAAAASWALDGSLDGKTVVIEASAANPAPPALASAVGALGGSVIEVAGVVDKPWLIWGAEADVILAGSKMGTLTHQGTPAVKASAIVPWGPVPVTTKAFAQLKDSSTVVLPDFVTASGALLAGVLEGNESEVVHQIVSSITAVLSELGSHADGVFLAGCYRAEAFMSTWQDKAPFGRPLA